MEEATFLDCGLALDKALTPFFDPLPPINPTVIKFKENFVDLNSSYEQGTTVGGCPKGQTYPFGLSNNQNKYLIAQNCCLNEKSPSGVEVKSALQDINLKYNERNFLSSETYVPFSQITVQVDAKAAKVDSTTMCIDRGAPVGSDDNKIPQPCGSGKVTEEACGQGENSRRLFKVNCGSVGTDGQISCDFKCYNGKDWNSGCEKTNESVCLSPTPEPLVANTFNSTNQTSNQAVAEVNKSCSQNLKQQDGSMLKSDYYTCYTVAELNIVTSIDNEGKILPLPTQSTVYPKKDNLPRRISTFYGQNKNESCKKLVGNTLTNGVCASQK